MRIGAGRWRAERGLRAERQPELDGPPPGRDLTYGEVALLAALRAGVLRFIARRELRALARARARLVHAALADRSVPSRTAAAGRAGPVAAGHAAALSLPRWLVRSVVAVVGFVEFQFWLTLGRQSVRVGDYTSPEALQAVALALLFPVVVFAGARIGAAAGYLSALPPGVPRRWYRVRAVVGSAVILGMAIVMAVTAQFRFAAESTLVGAQPLPVAPLVLAFFLVPVVTLAVHAFAAHPAEAQRQLAARDDAAGRRAAERRSRTDAAALARWHMAHIALDAEIRRVGLRYELDVAEAEARLLGDRARHGPAPALPAAVADGAAPLSWLGLPLLPVHHAVALSERVLRDYAPPPLPAATRLPATNGRVPASVPLGEPRSS